MGVSGQQSIQQRTWWLVGLAAAVAVGIGLLWLGSALSEHEAEPAPVADASLASPAPTTLLPTATLLPTVTPTPFPPTPTSAPPMVAAGPNGLNIRSGPGTSFPRLAHVDPGAQFVIIGRHADWWQIDFNGTPAWVFSDVVTSTNTDGVQEVQPPPSPTPAPTSFPTQVPATSTPVPSPTPDTYGILVEKFVVHNSGMLVLAPGPFVVDEKIWFDWAIVNTSSEDIDYAQLGAWIPELNKHTASTTEKSIRPGMRFASQDHIKVSDPGTYTMYLRICLALGGCIDLAGPVTFTVEYE